MTSERWHGTLGGYTNHKCRCVRCRAANAAYVRKRTTERAKLLADGAITVTHGLASTYGNYRCRCGPCTDAWSTDCYERKRRRQMTDPEFRRRDPAALAAARSKIRDRVIEIEAVLEHLEAAEKVMLADGWNTQSRAWMESFRTAVVRNNATIERLQWYRKFYTDVLKQSDSETSYFGNVAANGWWG